MKNSITKISLFILIGVIIFGCNTTKKVPDGRRLLTKNQIIVDGKAEKNDDIENQLYQKVNSSILGYRLRLNIFNLAKEKTDSIYRAKFTNNPKKYYQKAKWLSKKQIKRLGESFWYSGVHNFLRKTGEPPVILDTMSTRKSLKRLKSYYYNTGYFNVSDKFTVDTSNIKKAKLKYLVIKGAPYFVDSLITKIASPALDSMYQTKKSNSFIKSGKQFNAVNFNDERKRITSEFRNNGVYYFQQNYITYDVDTINTGRKANIKLIIDNQSIREEDSIKTEPFKVFKISRVNIFTDHSSTNPNATITDSVTYNNFNLYSVNKLKYRPKSLTDAMFINTDNVFSDTRTVLTSKYLSNLKVFNYPLIQYTEDNTKPNSLIANIYLIPRDKYHFGAGIDFTHSNIQDFGISGNTSVAIRNVFNGAETFEIAARGNVGSSRDVANPNNNFFNISEYGLDAKLNFPRLFLPFNTEKIIPKTMIPYTTFSVGIAKQTNVGLDKENFTSSLAYNWTPKRNITAKFDLFNIQFVRNVNVANYFNVYGSSYNTLNDLAIANNANTNYFYLDSNNDPKLFIESGTNSFLNDVLGENPIIFPTTQGFNTIRSINERKKRLTENNLIFASSFTYTKTTQKDIFDNTFYTFKTKLESAGNLLSLFARASKQLQNQNGGNTIFDVEFSQYLKSEFEFIKHWDLSRKKVLAMRSFFGIAIPYGNSNSVPFSRSYFAGGSNDNRAWQSYGLGPGKTRSINDFNEANMKIAYSAELRFNIFGQWNGAIFTDVGNIWNIADNIDDPDAIFSGLQSLENIAVGTGFGIRYDFNFFIVRLDLGFKTYNPALEGDQKWFKELNFSKSVINIGINYPF